MPAHTTDAALGDILKEDQSVADQRPEPQYSRAGSGRMTIRDFARKEGVTLRALRFYQSKGLLTPDRAGQARVYGQADREQLAAVLQGKRLGFTLSEIRDMLAARVGGCEKSLPISRKKCIEQIKLLERQRRDAERGLAELRRIYTGMFKAVLNAGDSADPAF
jgi:DNA-binding transcriptional MerR regulator